MNKQQAKKLDVFALDVAERYSEPDREFNYDNETFALQKIKPLSDTVAGGIYLKSSQKLALASFYWTNGSGGRWNYFFPSDSHILGFQRLGDLLYQVEQRNFTKNFD